MSTQPVESFADLPAAAAVFICTLGVRIKAPLLRNREGARERCLRDSLWSFSRSFPCLLLGRSFKDNTLPHAAFSEGGCRIARKFQRDGEEHHGGITVLTHQGQPQAAQILSLRR